MLKQRRDWVIVGRGSERSEQTHVATLHSRSSARRVTEPPDSPGLTASHSHVSSWIWLRSLRDKTLPAPDRIGQGR